MKNKTLMILFSTMLFFAGANWALAQQPNPGPPPPGVQGPGPAHPGWHGPHHRFGPQAMGVRAFLRGRLAERLNITDEQRDQIRALLKDQRSKDRPLLESLRETRTQLREATRFGQFDENSVRTLAQQQAQAMTDLLVSRERLKSRVYALLTPEQQNQLQELQQKMQDRRENRKNNRKN